MTARDPTRQGTGTGRAFTGPLLDRRFERTSREEAMKDSFRRSYHARSRRRRVLAPILLSLLPVVACSPPVERPKGAGGAYLDATDMFGRARYDRALEFTESVNSRANASPPNAYTDRARVQRAIILSGEEVGRAHVCTAV